MPAGTTEVSYISGIKKQSGSPIQKGIGGCDLCAIGSIDATAAVGFFKDAPDPTDPNSVPNTSWFDTDWNCQEWMVWHQAMVQRFGQELANQRFILYASQVSSWSSDHFCPYDSTFANYFRSQGIDFDNFVASVVVGTGNVVNNAGDVLTDTSDGLASVAKVLKWLLPVGVGLVAIGAGIYAKQTFFDKPKRRKRRG